MAGDPQLGFAQLRAQETGPLQAFQQGQQQAQKFAQGQALGQQKLRAGEQEFRLGQQEERLGQIEVSESEELRNAQIFNTSGRQLLTLGASPENQVVAARAMKQKFESAGLSTQPLEEFEAKLLAGDIDGANADLLGVIKASESILSGGAKAAQVQQATPVPGVGFITLDRAGNVNLKELNTEQKSLVTEALAQDATRKAEAAGLKKGAQEEAVVGAAAEKAKQKARGKGAEGRLQETIQFGLVTSKGIPILRRSLNLLNDIETGGFDNVSLKAKQIFGVEGADEAELSANLGKSVLSQLRGIFGAAFTAKEGQALKDIEAGFGKSTEGNKRLLQQAISVSEDAAKRAIKTARDSGDDATADQIQDFLDLELDPGKQKSAEQVQDVTTLSDEQLLQMIGQ